MQNKENFDEIFNPKPVDLLIGDNDSNVFACGKNYNTELTFKGYRYLINPSGLSLKKNKIIDVSSGNEHTALLTEFGYVFVFGSTLHNKLGLEGTTVINIGSPKLLPLSEQEQITQVVCGSFHTLALTEKDQVWGWGGTLHKKTGTRDSRPSIVHGFNKVKIIKIGCGEYHSVALSDQGILFSWGGGGLDKNQGQTGHGIKDDIQYPRPISFFKNSPVHDFKCGGYHTVTIQQDGLVFSWGQGLHGQLGHGDYKDASLPTQVEFEEELVIESIACGGQHTFFRTKDGLLYSCGNGSHGQTGQKNQDDLFHPTLVKSLQKKFVEKIECGQSHSIALVNPNFVYTCGLNEYGQLGVGDLEKRYKFTFVEKLANKRVTRIRAGGNHSWFIIDYDNPLVENYEPPSPCYSSPAMSQVNKSTEGKRFPKGLYKQYDKSQIRDKSKDSTNVLVPGHKKKPSITLTKSDFNENLNKKKSNDSLNQKNQYITSKNLNIQEIDMSDDDLLLDDDLIQGDIVDIKDQKNVFQNSIDDYESQDDDIKLMSTAKLNQYNQSKKSNKLVKNNKNNGDVQTPTNNKKIKRPKSNNFLKNTKLEQSNIDSNNLSFFKPANTSINKFIPGDNSTKNQNIKKINNKIPQQNNLLQPTGSIKFGKNSTFGSNPQTPRDHQDITIKRIPVAKEIPNYETNEKNDTILKKRKIWS